MKSKFLAALALTLANETNTRSNAALAGSMPCIAEIEAPWRNNAFEKFAPG